MPGGTNNKKTKKKKKTKKTRESEREIDKDRESEARRSATKYILSAIMTTNTTLSAWQV